MWLHEERFDLWPPHTAVVHVHADIDKINKCNKTILNEQKVGWPEISSHMTL